MCRLKESLSERERGEKSSVHWREAKRSSHLCIVCEWSGLLFVLLQVSFGCRRNLSRGLGSHDNRLAGQCLRRRDCGQFEWPLALSCPLRFSSLLSSLAPSTWRPSGCACFRAQRAALLPPPPPPSHLNGSSNLERESSRSQPAGARLCLVLNCESKHLAHRGEKERKFVRRLDEVWKQLDSFASPSAPVVTMWPPKELANRRPWRRRRPICSLQLAILAAAAAACNN